MLMGRMHFVLGHFAGGGQTRHEQHLPQADVARTAARGAGDQLARVPQRLPAHAGGRERAGGELRHALFQGDGTHPAGHGPPRRPQLCAVAPRHEHHAAHDRRVPAEARRLPQNSAWYLG